MGEWQTIHIESPTEPELLFPDEPTILGEVDTITVDVAVDSTEIAVPEPKPAVSHIAHHAIIDFAR